jgi:hypothetical protein
MRGCLKLYPTILDRFSLTREPFALLESRLYTAEEDSSKESADYFEHQGRRYLLSESDELTIFRNECFKAHQQEIQEYMSWVISFKLGSRLRSAASRLSSKANYYSSLKEHSISSFLLQVFNEFRHRKEDAPQHVEIDTEISSAPSIDDLHASDTIIYSLLQRPGIVSINGQCYQAEESPSTPSKDVLLFKEQPYNLSPFKSLEGLAKEYDIQLRGIIEKLALQHAGKFKVQIAELNARIADVSARIRGREAGGNPRKLGNIAYEPLGRDEYLIYVALPPYIMAKGSKFYCFGENGNGLSKKVEVGTILNIDSGHVSIEGPPIVLNMPYFHPFVHNDGGICYDDDARWEYLGIRFSPHKYRLDEKGLARKVANLLRESVTSLTLGYIGNAVHAVHDISRFTPVANNFAAARAYARTHEISEKRIFHN